MIPLVFFFDLTAQTLSAPNGTSAQADAPPVAPQSPTVAPSDTLAIPQDQQDQKHESNAAPVFFARLGGGLGELAGVGFSRFPIQVGGFALASPKGAFVFGVGYTFGRTPNGLTIHEASTSVGGRLASEAFSLGAQIEFGILGFSRVTTGAAIFAPTLGLRIEAAVRVLKFEEGAGALELGLGGGARLAPGGLSPFGGDLFARVLL